MKSSLYQNIAARVLVGYKEFTVTWSVTIQLHNRRNIIKSKLQSELQRSVGNCVIGISGSY